MRDLDVLIKSQKMPKALPHMFATLHIRLTGYKMEKFEQYLYARNGCVDYSGLMGAYKLISSRS